MAISECFVIAGYIRVSGLHQSKFGSSLSDQQKAIEDYARINGHNIYRIYSDEGFSGIITDRPALMRMKEDAQKGLFQQVAFTRLDRFGRSAQDTLSDYNYFEKLGISLHAIREGINTSNILGRYMKVICAGFAEMERERLLEKTISGRLARLAKGLRISPGPYGYSWSEKRGKYQVNPQEAAIYRRIVYDYLAEGKSQRKIAFSLNNDRIKSRFGKKWGQRAIGYILRHSAYKGHSPYIYQGQRFDVKYPPLINSDKWDDIQRRARENIHNVHKHLKKYDAFLLDNLLLCGQCKCGIYPYRQKDRRARYYICHSNNPTPLREKSLVLNGCGLPRIWADEIENQILGSLIEYLKRPDNMLKLLSHKNQSAWSEENRNNVVKSKNRLKSLAAKEKEYRELYNDEFIDKEELKKQEDALKASKQCLEEEIALRENKLKTILSMERKMNNLPADRIDLVQSSERIKDYLQEMTRSDWKGFLRALYGTNKLVVRHIQRSGKLRERDRIEKERVSKPVDVFESVGPINVWLVEGLEEINFNAAFVFLYASLIFWE